MPASSTCNLFSGLNTNSSCVHLRAAPRHSISPRIQRCKVRACGVAFFIMLLCSVAQGQLHVLPTSGKSVGVVTAPEAGKWLVFGPNSIKFVQPTILDGGKSCIFEGAAGEYAVVFLPPAADAQPLVANVVLGGSAPPPPQPTPPTPDELTVFGKQVRDWATALVPTASRAKAAALAASFGTIRAQMAAGTLKDLAAVITATYQANLAVLGDDREAWAPFREKLREYLNNQSKAGLLQTIEQHVAVWKDIEAGLRAVK